ncbi:MAG TPA: HAMP domain-containing protein [candidate division Zixibacteria bacterium]|nr:HAMP domain-containing protein [candidate division Zixibacteria bacterium]
MDHAKPSKPVVMPWHGRGLKWKISMAFSGLILFLGALVIAIVYHLTGTALKKQVDLRANAIATNLSDAAAGYVSRRSFLELDALIAKYGRLEGVAYAFIADPRGDVVASSLQPFPAELKEPEGTEKRLPHSRVTSVRGKSVFETRVPLLDGQLGAVYIGLWADAVNQDVQGTLFPIVGLIAVCLMAGIAISIVIASRTIKPILELKATADDISRGHLESPVSVQSDDEVGDLARSLERMRASLKAAMMRLNKA